MTVFAPASQSSSKKILFIELSEIGSAILAYSSIEKALRLETKPEVYFLTFQRNAESVALLNLIPSSHIISIDDRNLFHFLISTLRCLLLLRKIPIDTTIDLELFSRCTALLGYLSGARRRIGFHQYTGEGLYRGSLLTDRVRYNAHQHMSLNFLSLVIALETDSSDLPLLKINVRNQICPLPEYTVSQEMRGRVSSLLKSQLSSYNPDSYLMVINPDPGLLTLRGWATENFQQLCSQLCHKYPRTIIVIVGLARSRSYAEKIRAVVPANQFIDLTGKTKDLAELLTVFSLSKALITNDSGPAHIASLCNIKNFVLFGPETPALYGPLGSQVTNFYAELACSPCYAATNHRTSVCQNNRCLQAITVQEVFEQVEKIYTN